MLESLKESFSAFVSSFFNSFVVDVFSAEDEICLLVGQ